MVNITYRAELCHAKPDLRFLVQPVAERLISPKSERRDVQSYRSCGVTNIVGVTDVRQCESYDVSRCQLQHGKSTFGSYYSHAKVTLDYYVKL